MTPLLEMSDLTLGYNTTAVIKKVSFSVERGTIVALLGRNGAGKSTMLRGLAGIITPSHGKVQFLGKDITGWEPRSLIQMGMSYVAQGRECFPDLSVSENLEVAMLPFKLTRSERERRRRAALNYFPVLWDSIDEPVHHLSGGLRQMLVVAMGFAQEPKCILLDEASLGLSMEVLNTLQEALRGFVETGGSVVIVEQKPRVVFTIGDYAHYLEGGGIVVSGKPGDLRNNPLFIQHYLGLSTKYEGEL